MIHKLPATKVPVKSVHLSSQSDHDRLAMMMMQIDMALTLARQTEMQQVEHYLEIALKRARQAMEQQLN